MCRYVSSGVCGLLRSCRAIQGGFLLLAMLVSYLVNDTWSLPSLSRSTVRYCTTILVCFQPITNLQAPRPFLLSSCGLFERNLGVIIDQRRVDVLSDHDQKLPTKDFCLSVCPSVRHITFLSGYICSDTLRMF